MFVRINCVIFFNAIMRISLYGIFIYLFEKHTNNIHIKKKLPPIRNKKELILQRRIEETLAATLKKMCFI